MSSEIRFSLTQKGKPKLIDQTGHSYRLDGKNKDGTREYWQWPTLRVQGGSYTKN